MAAGDPIIRRHKLRIHANVNFSDRLLYKQWCRKRGAGGMTPSEKVGGGGQSVSPNIKVVGI